MTLDALLTILGMAVVTYAIRAGGLLVANRLPTDGFVARWMKHVPGAVLAALIAPAVMRGGPAEAMAAGATALVYILSRNLFAAMAGGVLAVYLARLVMG
jgi:uncharacterized membrane protein